MSVDFPEIEKKSKEGEPATPSAARFGTFAGVFTPNVLTILGLVLFLRIGYITAYAGLWHTLIIVLIAVGISLLTGLSLSAISTSMSVRAGGNYYIISRSLGLEIGGAIGIPLYMSQAISVAFYIIGFTESAQSISFFQQFDARLLSTAIAVFFILIAWIGADFAFKIQYVILAILTASLVSFFAGGWNTISAPILSPAYADGVTFWVVFAIFFPAVTGITVGASMSGDLKDPNISIPRGTISSILVTGVIYIVVVIWFAFHAPDRQELINNSMAIQTISIFPPLILAGVWASTLSSALGSIVAAPRSLQAIGRDEIVPTWVASNLGHATEPRMAVLLTGAIALVVIWMGDLNAVAPIISMFFLNTYGITNLAAGIEKLVGNPSYRPRFNIPWYLSILGAIGCYATMFLISWVATIVAIVITIGIYLYIQRQQISRTWGDARTGIWLAFAHYALLKLEGKTVASKNWRPNIMVFSGQPAKRLPLSQVANWLSRGKGVITFFQVIVQDIEVSRTDIQDLRQTALGHIKTFIQENGLEAFAEAEVVPDFQEGILTIAQAHGIGGLQSNTVLLGWSGTVDGRANQINLALRLHRIDKSIIFLHHDDELGFGDRKTINVWWRSRGGNADLMLLIGHIIRQHASWGQATIRLLRVVDSQDAVAKTQIHQEAMLKQVRVVAEPVVIVNEGMNRPIADIIKEQSQTADLTILGMNLPNDDAIAGYGEGLNTLIESVGSVLIVRSALESINLLSGEE
ncbi:MAG: amino acid transporter [Cellvibrionaceae bacterium]|jgi:amino acid transporter